MVKKKSISTNKISVYIFFQAIFLFIIIVTFRKIRALFPVPQASDSEIVGYAQYYGYPLYFDTFIFFTIMLSPIVICIIIDQFVKWKK